MANRTITETRMLRYNFTPDEHLANAAEMARLADKLSQIESDHKEIKAQLKSDKEAVLADMGRHVRLVRDKSDHRKIECRWIYDCPAVGQKTLRRNDTDTDVEVRRMEDHEKQESLNLQPVTEDLPLEEAAADPAPTKAYPDPPADFHGSLEELWHARCDAPPAAPGPALVNARKNRFGKE